MLTISSQVRVLYWPSTAPSGNVTNGQNGTAPATTTIDSFTLISPTVYVSYRTLYAQNSCGRVGPGYSDTIVPLSRSQDLSSLAYTQLVLSLEGPDDGGGLAWNYLTKSFNFGDLAEPTANSVYNQLPWCSSMLFNSEVLVSNARAGGIASATFNAANWTCEPHPPYAPLIALPTEIKQLNDEWASCTAWYGGKL